MSTKSESLDELFRNFKVDWYRCPIDRATLRDAMRKSDLQGLFQAVGHLMLAACPAALTIYFYLQEQWIGVLIALFAYGTMASNFNYGCHELGHALVFRTRWLNGVFLRVYSVLCWWNFHEYAMSHTYHHLYTLHPRADKEVMLPAEPSLKPLYLLQLFTINITGGFNTRGVGITILGTIKTAFGGYNVFGTPGWLEALYADRPEARRRAVHWARLMLAIHVLVAGLSIAHGLWIIPIIFSLGPDIANWLAYFVGAPMHCGLRDNVPDFRKCVRSIRLDPLSEFLYWRMNWHLEHHMFAGVPCYNLKKLHRAVSDDMPAVRSFLGSWREMREAWHRQKTEPGYQFDTPLPDTAGRAAMAEESEEELLRSSVGDIAPPELRQGGGGQRGASGP